MKINLFLPLMLISTGLTLRGCAYTMALNALTGKDPATHAEGARIAGNQAWPDGNSCFEQSILSPDAPPIDAQHP